MPVIEPEDVTRIMADIYYDVALADVDMRKATMALENIRSDMLESGIFEIWKTIDKEVGQSETDLIQNYLIMLREQFQEKAIAGEIEHLHRTFSRDPEAGWRLWLRTYAKVLVHWRLQFGVALAEENFPFPPEQKEETAQFRALTLHALHEQWADAYPLYAYLIEQEMLPDRHRARLMVTAGEIQLYYYLDPEKADELFSVARKLAGDDGRVLCGLGEYWLQKNEFEKAREFFRQSINQEPQLADGYLFMGDIFKKQGDHKQAEDYYQEAIRMSPGDSGGYLRLIRMNGEHEQFLRYEPRIMALLHNATAVDPPCEYMAYLDVGFAYEQNNMQHEAYHWYQKAIELDPNRIAAYISKGYTHLAEQNVDEARASFEKAVELGPVIFDGYWAMTWLLEQQDELEEALEWYQKCLELRPEWEVIIRSKIGEARRSLHQYQEAKKELITALKLETDNKTVLQSLSDLAAHLYKHSEDPDPEAAKKIYKEVREIRGPEAEADYQNNLGNVYFYNGDYEQAIIYLRKAIEADPDTAVYYANLTDTYVELQRWEEAEKSCKQAIERDPNRTEYYNLLGNIYHRMGAEERSVEWYRQAIERNPDYAVYHANLGLTYRNLHRWKEAAEAYQKALELDPGNAEYQNMLGVVYYNLGSHDELAIDYYQRAIEGAPAVAVYHANLGFIHRDIGNLPEAVEAYKQALEIEPANADYTNMLASTYYQMGHYQETINWVQKAIELAPGNDDYWNRLGLCYFQKLDFESALQQFQKAAEINPDRAVYHTNIGLAADPLGKRDEAERAYQKALELEPGNAENWNNLGIHYNNNLDFEQAARCYAKAINLDPDVPIYRLNLYSACEQIQDAEKLKTTLQSLPREVFDEFSALLDNFGNGRSN